MAQAKNKYFIIMFPEKNNCRPNTCHNNGVCKSLHRGVSCDCKEGFRGKYCEIEGKHMQGRQSVRIKHGGEWNQ